MIAVSKHGSRDFGKATAFVAVAIYCSIVQAAPAKADYEQAKAHFNSLAADAKRLIGLGLIGTGDYRGLVDFGFNRRFYKALMRFQLREGFAPDGELDSLELDRLKDRSAEFYDPLGLQYYDHPDAAAKLYVPRLAFDSETRTPRGLAFERNDKSLSLSFVAYPAEHKTFTQLYQSLSSETADRKVLYKRFRDGYFVVNGTYKSRHYYTWISSSRSGSTGFTLSWTSSSDELGSRLAIVLANSFLSGDVVNTDSNSADQRTGHAQEEIPQSTTDSAISIEDQTPRSSDGDIASVEDPTAPDRRYEDPAPPNPDAGTVRFNGDAAGPSEYWHNPLRSRTVEIKGYEFVFTPTGNGKKGRIRGASYFTSSHTGKYEVLRNDPRSFSIKVNIGDDDPTHTNAIDAKVEIWDRNATLTGTLAGKQVDQLTEIVRGDGSRTNPFFIKFSKGSLKWSLPE